MSARRGRLSSLILLGAVWSAAGCADGPIPGMSSLNPWLRKEWAADEQFGPTYYQKQTELARLRTSASGMAPAERAKLAGQLSARFRDEPSHVLRAELARTLAAFPEPTAEETLIFATTDQDADVRRIACEGLGKRSSTTAMNTLAQVVGSDTELDVRLAATRSLGGFNDPVAVRALGVGLEENDAAIRFAAMQSLKNSTGKDYGTSVAAWKEYVQGGNPKRPEGPTVAQQLGQWFYW